MKIYKRAIPGFLLLMIIITTTLKAQQKKYTFEELEGLGHDSIIKLAEGYIKAKDFNREIFNKVSIRKTNKKDLEQFNVTFSPSLMYLKRRHLFYSTVTVNLLTGSLGHTIESRWKRYKWDAPYYRHNREARRVIRFISKRIEKKDRGEALDKMGNSISVEIHEHFLYYQVEINSSSTYGFYRVCKITGRIYKEGHKHKMQEKEED
jgi:hypothetical protein